MDTFTSASTEDQGVTCHSSSSFNFYSIQLAKRSLSGWVIVILESFQIASIFFLASVSHWCPSLNLRRLGRTASLLNLGLSSLCRRADSLSSLVLGVDSSLLGLLGLGLDLVLAGSSSSTTTDGTNEEGKDGDNENSETASDLGNELYCLDGVTLGDGDEEVKLLLDVEDGVVGELEVHGGLGRVLGLILLGLGSLFLLLLNGALDLERLLGEGSGILLGVTDVDVVEEDVVLHGPKLKADL